MPLPAWLDVLFDLFGVRDLPVAARAFYNFFAAGYSDIRGIFLFILNTSFVFGGSFSFFNAVDDAGPVVALVFYTLVAFAYVAVINQKSSNSRVGNFFALVALILGIISGMAKGVSASLFVLFILCKLTERGFSGWIKALARFDGRMKSPLSDSGGGGGDGKPKNEKQKVEVKSDSQRIIELQSEIALLKRADEKQKAEAKSDSQRIIDLQSEIALLKRAAAKVRFMMTSSRLQFIFFCDTYKLF